MERIKVKSSNIKSIGYDEITKTLEVEFTNSGVYQYKEVPKEIYEGFNKAESIGSYFAKNVRAKGFAYLKVPEIKKVEDLGDVSLLQLDKIKDKLSNVFRRYRSEDEEKSEQK